MVANPVINQRRALVTGRFALRIDICRGLEQSTIRRLTGDGPFGIQTVETDIACQEIEERIKIAVRIHVEPVTRRLERVRRPLNRAITHGVRIDPVRVEEKILSVITRTQHGDLDRVVQTGRNTVMINVHPTFDLTDQVVEAYDRIYQ